MPKIPASKSEEYRQKLYDMHAKKQAKKLKGIGWGTVIATFLFFTVLGVAGLLMKQPLVWWAAIVLGNAFLFFQILYIVIRGATRKQ